MKLSSGQKKVSIGVFIFVTFTIILLAQKKVQFILGGAFLNAGYFMQDGLKEYDYEHGEDITPQQVVDGLISQNDLSSTVRQLFPRFPYHPLVAMVICMDSRIDTNEVIGDTRKYYYIIRTAGSVIKEKEEEMLELAVVEKEVKVIVLTTHTNCAAEAIAKDPQLREKYPHIVKAVERREQDVQDFLARPEIAKRVKDGTLIVKHGLIDTHTKRLTLLD